MLPETGAARWARRLERVRDAAYVRNMRALAEAPAEGLNVAAPFELSGICELDGRPRAAHPRCRACGLLVGTKHYAQAVNAAGICQECACR